MRLAVRTKGFCKVILLSDVLLFTQLCCLPGYYVTFPAFHSIVSNCQSVFIDQ